MDYGALKAELAKPAYARLSDAQGTAKNAVRCQCRQSGRGNYLSDDLRSCARGTVASMDDSGPVDRRDNNSDAFLALAVAALMDEKSLIYHITVTEGLKS